MRGVWKMALMAGAAALMLSAGLAMAAAGRQGVAADGAARPMGPNGLIMLMPEGANVQVTNIDKGVRLNLTAEQPDQVRRIQTTVANRAAALGEAQGRGAGRRAEGVLGMVASGEVKLTTDYIDTGAVLILTSENAEVVKQIQTEVAAAVQARQAGAAGAERMRTVLEQMRPALEQARAADALLASGQVKIDVKETDKGVVVQIISDDPKVAKELKDRLPTYFQGLPERAKLMEQLLNARGAGGPAGAGAAEGARARRAGGARGARQPEQLGQPAQPAQPATTQ